VGWKSWYRKIFTLSHCVWAYYVHCPSS